MFLCSKQFLGCCSLKVNCSFCRSELCCFPRCSKHESETNKKNFFKLYITLFEKHILIFSFFWFSRWLRPFTNQVNLIKLKTVKLLNKWLFYNKTNINIFIYYIPTCLQGRLRWSFKGLGLGNTFQIRQPQLFPIQKWD